MTHLYAISRMKIGFTKFHKMFWLFHQLHLKGKPKLSRVETRGLVLKWMYKNWHQWLICLLLETCCFHWLQACERQIPCRGWPRGRRRLRRGRVPLPPPKPQPNPHHTRLEPSAKNVYPTGLVTDANFHSLTALFHHCRIHLSKQCSLKVLGELHDNGLRKSGFAGKCHFLGKLVI